MRVRAGIPDDHEPRPRAWSIALAGYVAIAGYLVVARDLRADVPQYLAGEMRDALWMIAAELFAIAVVWTARGALSLTTRAALTFVVVFGYLGEPLLDHHRERMAIDLHVAWLGWARAADRYCARSE
jgi:hypothetical protein